MVSQAGETWPDWNSSKIAIAAKEKSAWEKRRSVCEKTNRNLQYKMK